MRIPNTTTKPAKQCTKHLEQPSQCPDGQIGYTLLPWLFYFLQGVEIELSKSSHKIHLMGPDVHTASEARDALPNEPQENDERSREVGFKEGSWIWRRSNGLWDSC